IAARSTAPSRSRPRRLSCRSRSSNRPIPQNRAFKGYSRVRRSHPTALTAATPDDSFHERLVFKSIVPAAQLPAHASDLFWNLLACPPFAEQRHARARQACAQSLPCGNAICAKGAKIPPHFTPSNEQPRTLKKAQPERPDHARGRRVGLGHVRDACLTLFSNRTPELRQVDSLCGTRQRWTG